MSGDSMKAGPCPHTTIGCQDLLTTGEVSHSGMLKKRLAYRKKTGSTLINTLLWKLPWIHRYVVLHSGSLYHFTDAVSKKPSGCYSLYGYNQVVRAGDVTHSKQPWAFKIVHISNDLTRIKYFCTGSETEMKTWMREIRSQLVIANGSLISQSQLCIGGVVTDEDVEKPVYSHSDELTAKVEKHSVPEEDSDDDDYLEIDEHKLGNETQDRSSRPLPQLPGDGKPNVGRSSSRNEPDGQRILNLMNESYGDDVSALSRSRVSGRAKLPLPDEDESPPGRRMSGKVSKVSKENSFSDKATPLPTPPRPRPGIKPPSEDGSVNPWKQSSLRKPESSRTMNNNVTSPKKSSPPAVPAKPSKLVSPSHSFEERSLPSPPGPVTQPKPQVRQRKQAEVPALSGDSESAYDFEEEQDLSCSEAKKLIRWNEVYWDGMDKQACEQIIANIGVEGVYMVRESDKPGCVKTLVCFADTRARKYMIKQSSEGQYFIKDELHFPSIISLLYHYHQNNLPNRTVPLMEPYTKHTRDS